MLKTHTFEVFRGFGPKLLKQVLVLGKTWKTQEIDWSSVHVPNSCYLGKVFQSRKALPCTFPYEFEGKAQKVGKARKGISMYRI